MGQKLYKVLINGESYNGGNFKYSLPRKRGKGWQPGAWTPAVQGKVSVCNNGYHLTSEPFRWYKWNADIYEAEGAGDSDTEGDKTAYRSVRLLKQVPAPKWITDAQDFITKIPNTPWFKNDGNPKQEWKIYPTRAAAWDAARDAARAAAWDAARDAARAAAWDAAWAAARAAAGAAAGDAAWDAAWDAVRAAARAAAGDAARAAGLYVRVEFICSGLQLEEKHREHARVRWEVWAKGYGLLCDVDGVLYVYEKL